MNRFETAERFCGRKGRYTVEKGGVLVRGFYEAVSQCGCEEQNLAVTVLDGPHFGEKALFADGQLIFASKEKGYLEEYGKEIWMAANDRKACRDGIAVVRDTRIFCDWLGQESHLVICGGGHVSIPVIEIGRMLGFQVTVLEDRPAFAENARQAGACQVICESFEAGLDQIPGSSSTYFVLVTRGHIYDQICLKKIIEKPHAYIGMLGNRKRVQMVKAAVLEYGADPQVIECIHTPIGLDIGAETPAELGVAIMAEIIQIKNHGIRKNGYSRDMLHALLRAEGEGEAGVLATIVRKKGSTPREPGTKMFVQPDGRCIGTIGGGGAEAAMMKRALKLLQSGAEQSLLCCVNMAGEESEEEGSCGGGVIYVLLERISGEGGCR